MLDVWPLRLIGNVQHVGVPAWPFSRSQEDGAATGRHAYDLVLGIDTFDVDSGPNERRPHWIGRAVDDQRRWRSEKRDVRHSNALLHGLRTPRQGPDRSVREIKANLSIDFVVLSSLREFQRPSIGFEDGVLNSFQDHQVFQPSNARLTRGQSVTARARQAPRCEEPSGRGGS